MGKSNPSPLRKVAIEMGIIPRGSRELDGLPLERYEAIYDELSRAVRPNPVAKINQSAAELVSIAVLGQNPLSALTYVCVSDYVGGTRYRAQNGSYALTSGEQQMFERASAIRTICQQQDVIFEWRLILADGWGLYLYGERVHEDALAAYCIFMEEECQRRDFEAIRWSEFMAQHHDIYTTAKEEIIEEAEKLAPWEAAKGEIAHDKPDPDKALELAKEHIMMRASEGRVFVAVLGPSIVLSTEERSLTRYDNLLVSQKEYPLLYVMPVWPHRIQQQCGPKKD